MPTWRNYITEENFDKSDYKNEWFGLFYSDRLNELCKKYNYKVLIQLHPIMKKFVGNFVISENVQFSNGERYQNLFLKSKILITDYSSTAFDMAYLNKKVIYFQFDEEDFFSGNHSYEKGYYDYRVDGFGPVVTNTDDLLLNLEKCLYNNSMDNLYQNRIDKTFILRDANNSERCFNAISNLLGETR